MSISEREYNIVLGKLIANPASITNEEANRFVDILNQFESMLDEGDADDYFGTEGWRHNVGWD